MTNPDLEPWQWSEDTWRGYVRQVRAGRSLAPESWPGGARAAVALAFDADHETIPLRDGDITPSKLSQGEYGSRVGSRRILALLDRFRVPATFFMPAVSAMLHPEEIRNYAAAGHEIGLHGWIHERNTLLPPAAERDLSVRALDVLEELSGQRAVGVRTCSWDFSGSTLSVFRELGLLYDSSLMADDDPYELVEDGSPTGIVELPPEWILDDVPYFHMDRYGTARPHSTPGDVLSIWKSEFDGAYQEGGLFLLTMHPHVIGHRSRMAMLSDLLAYISAHNDVWFATHADVARYVLSAAEE